MIIYVRILANDKKRAYICIVNNRTMKFKSLPQLLDYFQDEATSIEYYEKLRWNGKPTCPHCRAEKPYRTKVGFKCSDVKCHKKFTVKVGTIFQKSRLPLRIWFAAIFLATSHKKGISSVQLASDLGVKQHTAWFMLHRIREMMKNKKINEFDGSGIIEADETYVGGKDQKKHFTKRRSENNPTLTNDGSLYKEKSVVLGLIQRDGKVVLKHVKDKSEPVITDFIKTHVPKGFTIYTDEYGGYSKLKFNYSHKSIKHRVEIYAHGNVNTNSIESFWGVFKRGLMGIYHQVSDKHLERYLDEFSSRFNARQLGNQDRMELFLRDSESYLSYNRLVEVAA